MKTLKLLFIGIILFLASTAQAQVSVNLNIGSPPMWGPVGYTDVQYYYLPDVQAYYDVNSSMFIYYSGRTWVHRSYLPSRYRNYDLYGGYKVVMNDYHGNTPYTHFKEHKMKYRRGYHGDMQRTIGERPGRGNPGPNYTNKGGRDNQAARRSNAKHNGHGNDRHMNNDQGHGGGHGKKK